jgi:hypothetical protein
VSSLPRDDAAKASRHFRAWTTLVIGSQAAMLWGLQLPAGFLSSLGVNLGFFGLLGAAVGVTRPVFRWLRFGPAIIGTTATSLVVCVLWLVRGDHQIAAAFATVVVLFALMIAVVWTAIALLRRGLIVQTPLRRNLVLALVVWMSLSAIISWPVGVGKGWMGVAALGALFAILLWPPRSGREP